MTVTSLTESELVNVPAVAPNPIANKRAAPGAPVTPIRKSVDETALAYCAFNDAVSSKVIPASEVERPRNRVDPLRPPGEETVMPLPEPNW